MRSTQKQQPTAKQAWCLASTETIRIIRDGDGGWGRGMEMGEERDILYISLHCHHHNDFCITMGSDESCFNVQ